MANFLKSARVGYKKYRKSPFFRARFIYTKMYEKTSVNENEALFEAFSGDGFTGNPFYLLKEMCADEKYSGIKKYIAIKEPFMESTRVVLDNYGLSDVVLVPFYSKEYCRLLAQAKFLVNNVAFPTFFIKKEGQVYLNTWHGTPLKTLGRSIRNNPHLIGNVQRNFLMTDYILFPNEHTFEHMRKDYMLEHLYKGKYVLGGYPCNSVLFDTKRADELKTKFSLEGKKIAVYMPTWRDKESGKSLDKQIYYIMYALYELDKRLDENTVLFVKLHHLASGEIRFADFEKIKAFPEEYETYDILNLADCLITDYSSVMFDFANKGKEVILYSYDKDEYLNGRSMYLDIDTLPFYSTPDIKELCDKINSVTGNTVYTEFRKNFCTYDNPNASKSLLKLLTDGVQDDNLKVINGVDYHNGKENVLLFPGALLKNGITTAFRNLIFALEEDKSKNYIITFYQKRVEPNKNTVLEFENYDYIGIQGAKNATLFEGVIQSIFMRMNLKTKGILKIIKRINEREIKRLYPGLEFSYTIHFSGYESKFFAISGAMDNCRKLVWVHNNMIAEGSQKRNFHINSLKIGYANADKIAVVRESLKEELLPFVNKGDEDKLVVVHNVNDIEGIKEKAAFPLEFNDDTYSNVSVEELSKILEDDCEKFINIARFSKEKGLDRLVKAFSKYRKESPESYLIIIGGYGKEFSAVNALVEEFGDGHIVIIKSITNPYPILAKCDEFILSSYYEGLPMTIIEALILGVPVVSTNIPGPREFLEKGYGRLVEDSDEGVLKAFKMFKSGEIKPETQFNAEEFNENALKEFYSLFD